MADCTKTRVLVQEGRYKSFETRSKKSCATSFLSGILAGSPRSK